MHKLELFDGYENEISILCLGAHSDDIEIGCGGTLLRSLQEKADVSVKWVVLANDSNLRREQEVKRSAEYFLDKALEKEIIVKDFRDGFLPYQGEEVKDYFEILRKEYEPDIVFTHYRRDLHQDHRLISELTWNTFRDHLILEYEILKYDGGLGSPNFFVPVSNELFEQKMNILLEIFKTQKSKQWFSRDALKSLMCVRGVECNSDSGYAEAFYCNKIII